MEAFRLCPDLVESVDQRRLIDGLRSLRVPRQLFKFLYRLLVAHCHAHTDEAPVWRIPLDRFDGEALRAWTQGLGVETFVGSSGRVFPKDLKAAPLLRAWLSRLRGQGVRFHMRHRWLGWDEAGGVRLRSPDGESTATADAVERVGDVA